MSISDLEFPVLFFGNGRISLVRDRLVLCSIFRWEFQIFVAEALGGEQFLLSSKGMKHKISNWIRCAPSGWSPDAIFRRIIGVAVEPVLADGKMLSLPRFKKEVASAIWQRYRYDIEPYEAYDAFRRLKVAQTYLDALLAVGKR